VFCRYFWSRGDHARASPNFEQQRDLCNSEISADSQRESIVRVGNLYGHAGWRDRSASVRSVVHRNWWHKELAKNQTFKAKEHCGIPTHPKLKEALSKYQDELENCKWLFPSQESATGHLTRAQAHNILRKAFDALELEDASTHSMRRTCLTNMSRAGVPLRTIQEISGHSSLSALQAYLAVDPDDKRRAINLLRY